MRGGLLGLRLDDGGSKKNNAAQYLHCPFPVIYRQAERLENNKQKKKRRKSQKIGKINRKCCESLVVFLRWRLKMPRKVQ